MNYQRQSSESLDWETFLHWPDEQVWPIAPATVVLSLGGTRRSAVLAGIPHRSDEYARWTRDHVYRCVDLLFQHGIVHVLTNVVIPANLVEFAGFRERFERWVVDGMAGSEALTFYAKAGCRVNLVGGEEFPALAESLEHYRHGLTEWTRTLWWVVVTDEDLLWRSVLSKINQAQARTRQEAVRAFYGEDLPPARMLIAFGKPIVADSLVPPLLTSDLQCYWIQRPGHSLDRPMLRRILYDYAYTRATGSGSDRVARYQDVLAQRTAWETNAVLGVGRCLGGFWYPEPFPLPDAETIS